MLSVRVVINYVCVTVQRKRSVQVTSVRVYAYFVMLVAPVVTSVFELLSQYRFWSDYLS